MVESVVMRAVNDGVADHSSGSGRSKPSQVASMAVWAANARVVDCPGASLVHASLKPDLTQLATFPERAIERVDAWRGRGRRLGGSHETLSRIAALEDSPRPYATIP